MIANRHGRRERVRANGPPRTTGSQGRSVCLYEAEFRDVGRRACGRDDGFQPRGRRAVGQRYDQDRVRRARQSYARSCQLDPGRRQLVDRHIHDILVSRHPAALPKSRTSSDPARQELDDVARRQNLDLPAPRRRAVPQGLRRMHVRGRGIQHRQGARPEAGRRQPLAFRQHRRCKREREVHRRRDAKTARPAVPRRHDPGLFLRHHVERKAIDGEGREPLAATRSALAPISSSASIPTPPRAS